MIISGGSRRAAGFFARHLMRADENEKVTVTEIRGLAADNVREAFREMQALASGTNARNYFYHANLNPRDYEHLTPGQWEQAVDTLERNLGLENHSRFVVRHEKNGRVHQHVIWSRIDVETMTAVSDSRNYAAHERTARELERAFGHLPVQGVHVQLDGSPRAERRAKNWETFRGHRSGIDPDQVKAELTDLWRHCDTGAAFKHAIEERGYVLCRGDKRTFVVIDKAGDDHSLTRRLKGFQGADVRSRMADLDLAALPSVEEGRALARDAAGGQVSVTEIDPDMPLTGPGEALRPLDEYLAARAVTEPDAEITGSIARDLEARFNEMPDGRDAGEDGPEVQPGDRREAQEELPPGRDTLHRTTPWGRAWRAFADRTAAFAEAAWDLMQDERSGASKHHSWAQRTAHLAATGLKALAGRTPRAWSAFVDEGIGFMRDRLAGRNPGGATWTERSARASPAGEDASWVDRTGRGAAQPGAAADTTRDPFDAVQGGAAHDGGDPPAPAAPGPEIDAPDIG